MDWNLVKTFLAVCETGSQVRAASRTGQSHATVFRHMALLEKQIGTRLFDRIRGRYVLTDAGRDMQDLALDIAQGFDDIGRRIAGRDTGAEGLVRLTVPRSFAETVVPRYLADFCEVYPAIQVELLVSNQEVNMADRTADIALRVSSSPPDHLWGRRVLSIDWSVYASPDYLVNHDPLAQHEDLARHRLIAPAGPLARHPAYRRVLEDGQALYPLKCDDLTVMASLAAQGQGVALLPDDLRRPDLVRCFTYPHASQNTLWVLTHMDLRTLPRVSVLMGNLARAFSTDPYWARAED